MSVVIVHPRDGVFLGEAMGLGFWSKLDPVGQDAAPTFTSVTEAERFMRSWEGGRPEGVVFRAVETDRNGTHASLEACVKAGLPAWDPNAKSLSSIEDETSARGMLAKAQLMDDRLDGHATFMHAAARAAQILENPDRHISLADGKYRMAVDRNVDGKPMMAQVNRKGEPWRYLMDGEPHLVVANEAEKALRLKKALLELGSYSDFSRHVASLQSTGDKASATQLEALGDLIGEQLKPIASDVDRVSTLRGSDLLHVAIPGQNYRVAQGSEGGLFVVHDDGRKESHVGDNLLLAAGYALETAQNAVVEIGGGYLARVAGASRQNAPASPSLESADHVDRQEAWPTPRGEGSINSSRSMKMADTATAEKTESKKKPLLAERIAALSPADARAEFTKAVDDALKVPAKGGQMMRDGVPQFYPSFQVQVAKAELEAHGKAGAELPEKASKNVASVLKTFEGAVKQPEFTPLTADKKPERTGTEHSGKKGIAHLAETFGDATRAGSTSLKFRAVHLDPAKMKAIIAKMPDDKVKGELETFRRAQNDSITRTRANMAAKEAAKSRNKEAAGVER